MTERQVIPDKHLPPYRYHGQDPEKRITAMQERVCGIPAVRALREQNESGFDLAFYQGAVGAVERLKSPGWDPNPASTLARTGLIESGWDDAMQIATLLGGYEALLQQQQEGVQQ